MRRNKQKELAGIAIIVAIIGALGYLGQGYYQGLGDTQYKDRPILDWSLGTNNTFPTNMLEHDQTGYFIDLFADNRGQSDGKIIFEIKGTNAKVQLSPDLGWGYDQSLHFTVHPNPVMKSYKIYVMPDPNETTISFELLSQDAQDKPQFQEINPYIPLKLTYQETNGTYDLIR